MPDGRPGACRVYTSTGASVRKPVVAGLIGQGLSILDVLKKSASVTGAVAGTVAGDDTLLIIAPDNKKAKQLQSRLEEMRA